MSYCPNFFNWHQVSFTLIASVIGLHMSVAQPSEGPDMPIDAKVRTEVVNSLLTTLTNHYVFPKVAAQIQHTVQNRINKGEYNHISSSQELAKTLTSQLRQISQDKHLGMYFQNSPIQKETGEHKLTPEEETARQQFAHEVNFGFEKIDRLAGNIGYLRLDGFMPTTLAAETATAAMTYLAYTNALILDLRHNRGGDPAMVSFLASYFFGPDSVHLNDLYWREGNQTHQFWTLSQLPGPRYMNKPVYILTSNQTFSAGEEFAYDLQSLKRATIVGEFTGGGANPGGPIRISDHFSAFIPTGRAINPITKTNWEGVGVKPDIEIPEMQALKTAHLRALETLLYSSSNEKEKSKLIKVIDQMKSTN